MTHAKLGTLIDRSEAGEYHFTCWFNKETLDSRGIDQGELFRLLNEAIESVPVKPKHKYEWALTIDGGHLLGADGVAYERVVNARGQHRFIAPKEGFCRNDKADIRSILLEHYDIDPSDVKPEKD